MEVFLELKAALHDGYDRAQLAQAWGKLSDPDRAALCKAIVLLVEKCQTSTKSQSAPPEPEPRIS